MFNDNDFDSYSKLKSVIASGKFELSGDAVTAVSSLFKWYDELESKMKIVNTPVLTPEKSKRVK